MTSKDYATDSVETSSPFDIRPLMFENFVCTMALMSFVALAGPIGHVLGLAPWQIGTTVTVAGLSWMLLSRVWGRLSDRHGRRTIMLTGLAGFAICYAGLCLFVDYALTHTLVPSLAFIGILLWRGSAGVFYAAVPPTATALIADHTPPEKRTAAIAMIGAASGAGMVIGPAFAGMLAPYGLNLPLYAIAVLPALAFVVLWRTLPRTKASNSSQTSHLPLTDKRLRRPMVMAFINMFSVAIAQITVGFFAIDRLHLSPQQGAKVAGIALTCVGLALIVSQLVVRKLSWPPMRFIRSGGIVAGIGFSLAALATTPEMLWACYFLAAAGMGWVWPSVSAYAANAVSQHEQGATAGTISAAQGLGVIIGPLAGTLIYSVNIAAPYIVIGILLVIMALWPSRSAARAPS